MKKIAAILTAILLLCAISVSADVTETITFAWEQDDTTNLAEWRLYWSDVAGGPYDEQEIAIIEYIPGTGPTHQGPATATVVGEQGTHVTKYFVLVACGNIPQEDGNTAYMCSEDSNEVSYDFWIPAGMFSVPVDFRIIAQ